MNRIAAAKQEMENAIGDLDMAERLVAKADKLLSEAISNLNRAKIRLNNAAEALIILT